MRRVQVGLALTDSGEWDLEVAEWDFVGGAEPGVKAGVLAREPGLLAHDVPGRLRALVDSRLVRRDTAVVFSGIGPGGRPRVQVWDLTGRDPLMLPRKPAAGKGV